MHIEDAFEERTDECIRKYFAVRNDDGIVAFIRADGSDGIGIKFLRRYAGDAVFKSQHLNRRGSERETTASWRVGRGHDERGDESAPSKCRERIARDLRRAKKNEAKRSPFARPRALLAEFRRWLHAGYE